MTPTPAVESQGPQNPQGPKRPVAPLTPHAHALIRRLAAASIAALIDAGEGMLRGLVRDGVQAGVLTTDNALRVSRAVRTRTLAQMPTGASGRDTAGDDAATRILTLLAVFLEVPVTTWTQWMTQSPGPPRQAATVARQWVTTWAWLAPEDWTAGRVVQAAEVLSAVAPRIPAEVAQQLLTGWRAGAGPMAGRLRQSLPPAVFDAIQQGASYDQRVRPIAAVAAEVDPLRSVADIRALARQANWGTRPIAERCGVLRRCRFDGAGADVQSALRELICVVLLPDDEGQVPGLRALVRAQGTVAARGATIAWLSELSSTAEPLMRDGVVLAFCAEEMSRVPGAARIEALVTLVLGGWQILPAPLWSRAVAQIVRQQSRRADAEAHREVRHALRDWWAACEDPAIQVDPTLVTECLASPDRTLSTWAMLQMVPRVAADQAPPTASPSAAPSVEAASPKIPSRRRAR